MILRFGFRNFLSFEEGVECSFESDSKSAESVNTLLNIRGANGAGKTNLLKALAFFMHFVADSFNLKPDAPTGITPFFNSKKATDFFVEFKTGKDSCTYLYELSLTKDCVISEKITRTNGRRIPIIFRHENVLDTIHEFDELKKIKLRKNASLVSCANQNEILSLKDIYSIFSNVLDNVHHSDIALPFDCAEDYGKGLLSTISRLYLKQEKLFEKTKKFISECDLGISNIEIEKESSISGQDVYLPLFIHQSKGKTFALPYSSESRGTQFLYINLRLFLWAQKTHSLLIFDELDMSLHSFMVKKIISLFMQNERSACNCGQMIFTAHDTNIMDELKADKSYLLNKEDNESFGYRVDECPSAIVRRDRSIRTPYEQGRIGGVPKI